MKISITTPTLNQGQFLEQTIDSVLSQEYPDLEYVVIDGGSTDKSVDLIRKYEKHLAYWCSKPDNGQSQAINKGIKQAEGDIVNWLNADDYYEADALNTVAKWFCKPEVKVICGTSRLFNEEETVKFSRGTDVYFDNLYKTIGWARIDQPETFFRKEAWDEVGLLNEKLHYAMDREWWMRYLYHFGLDGIVKIENVLVNFRLHDQSKTISANEKFQIEHDTIFYLLSTRSQNKKIEQVIRSYLNIDYSIDSEVGTWTNQTIIEGSINYFLLKRAEELYYRGRHEVCKRFLQTINPVFLAKEDLSLYRKIKLRSSLPHSVISFFRK